MSLFQNRFLQAGLTAFAVCGTFNAVADTAVPETKAYAGPEAEKRYKPELFERLPQLAGLPEKGMPMIVLTTEDLRSIYPGPYPSILGGYKSPEWKATRQSLYKLFNYSNAPEEIVELFNSAVENAKVERQINDVVRALLREEESSTRVPLAQPFCMLAMQTSRETPIDIIYIMAQSSAGSLPRLDELVTPEIRDWFLVHEATHCGESEDNDAIGYSHRLGNEATADERANLAFPGTGALTLRVNAISPLHLARQIMPERTETLNLHATALPLLVGGKADAYKSEESAEAYKELAMQVILALYKRKHFAPESPIMLDVLTDVLSKQTDPAEQERIKSAIDTLGKATPANISAAYAGFVSTSKGLDDLLTRTLVNATLSLAGALSDPRVIAPALQGVLQDNAVKLSPLARSAGLLYLRAAADLNPALVQYALPLPDAVKMPPLPTKSASLK